MADAIHQGVSGFDTPRKNNANRGGVTPAQSLGAVLRQRREAMGVSLAEVEVATRIRQKYLAAIESDEWHLLPGEVVGRGFLSNYSAYLGLEPHEVVDRRRAVTDPGLVAALSKTSSGASLPPERQVDYRPKEVELKDDADGIQRGEIRLTPILSIVAVAALVALVWFGVSRLREPLTDSFGGAKTQVARIAGNDGPTATPVLIGIVNTQNVESAGNNEPAASVENDSAAQPPQDVVPPVDGGNESGAAADSQPPAALIVMPTSTPTEIPPTEAPVAEPPTPTQEPPTLEPPTPTPEPPTPTPEPPTPEPPTPTVVPEEPTATPEPPAPVAVSASCADPRAVLTSPGMNQVVSGVVALTGTAVHDNMDYYKLEYAPGPNAQGGFVYFDGQNAQIQGGQLGAIDTRNLPNGEYTLRVTVVDQTGNFPPPCDVTITVQN
ncbi:MAG: helix-turn-helix domain-containing protein [Caldilineaceae bacterium]